MALYYAGRIAVPSTSKQSLHERFTSFMKNRPSKLDVVATPAKASDRNQRLAAEMESRESVKSQIHPDEKRWHNHQRHHPYGHYAHPYQQHHHQHRGGGGGGKEKGNKGRNKKNARKNENQKSNNENDKNNDEKARGGKTKQPKVIPDQSELDAELDAYNKAREAKLAQEKTAETAETADPLVDNGKEGEVEDILKESKPAENANDDKTV